MNTRPPQHRLTSAQRARDEALERVRATRRWAIMGSGALTLGVAALVSAVAPGRTLGARFRSHAAPASTATSSRGASTSAQLTMPPAASPAQLGLRPPGSPPQSAPVPPPPSSAPSSGGQSAAASAPSGGAVSGGS